MMVVGRFGNGFEAWQAKQIIDGLVLRVDLGSASVFFDTNGPKSNMF